MTQAEIDLIKDTKKRTAQRHKAELLADLAVFAVIIFICVGLAFAVADTVFGPEAVTNWLAALVM